MQVSECINSLFTFIVALYARATVCTSINLWNDILFVSNCWL